MQINWRLGIIKVANRGKAFPQGQGGHHGNQATPYIPHPCQHTNVKTSVWNVHFPHKWEGSKVRK